MSVNRKLVAVVVADVAGYSRLMERDEAGTHQRLVTLREELLDPKIAEHGGRTVKTSGDGMLLEFPSATSALRCAVEIQREMGVRNLYLAPDARIEFRIGIDLGDIIGDGVKVAARLESLADPGGICAAAAVWEQVHEDLGIEFGDAGEVHVENIARPIRVFRVALGKGPATKAAASAPPFRATARALTGRHAAIVAGATVALAVAGIGAWQWSKRPGASGPAAVATVPARSLAVFPFAAPAGDAALNALAETLTVDVPRALANSLRDAQVVAPASAAAATGAPTGEPAPVRAGNARYRVDGDLRGVGADVVVNLRLADTATGKQLGSERRAIGRDRAAEDVELLVARVTAAARVMFQNAEGRRVASEPIVATDAQGLVERAQAIFTGEDLASTRAARLLYDQARERDPVLVAAWIGHLWTLVDEHWLDFAAGRDERLLAEIDRDSRRGHHARRPRSKCMERPRDGPRVAMAVGGGVRGRQPGGRARSLALLAASQLALHHVGTVRRGAGDDREYRCAGGSAEFGARLPRLPREYPPRPLRRGNRRMRARGREGQRLLGIRRPDRGVCPDRRHGAGDGGQGAADASRARFHAAPSRGQAILE